MMMAHTPQHNDVGKHMNQTLLDKVCSTLTDTDLPQSFWFNTLQYAVAIHNVTPTCALDDMVPKEAWGRDKPNISSFHIFGCKAFVHVLEKHHSKLTVWLLICTFLGYVQNQKAYKLLNQSTHCLIECHDVVFDEGGAQKAV
jgi:hypothetical protein